MISMHRAATALAAASLVAGLGATSSPAMADGGHKVTVTIDSMVPGWTVAMQCAPDAGGATVQRQVSATSLILVQRAVVTGVANATCTIQATAPDLIAAGLPGGATATGVRVTKDVSVRLTPSVVSCLTCLPISGVVGTVGGSGTAGSGTTSGSSTPAPAATPQIAGKPVVGGTITAAPAAAPAGATITGYQWYVKRVVNGHQRTILVRIKGAHHKSLRMKERLAGKHVLVGVTYTMAGSKPTTLFSKAVKIMKERMKE